MRIERLYTKAGEDIYATIVFQTVVDEEMRAFQLPASWSAAAADTFVRDVFWQRPLPTLVLRREERGVPRWLWTAEADESEARDGYERDAREVFHRLSGGWTYQAWKAGVFDSENDARAFYDELCYMLLHQMVSPERALWKNTGLHWAYGVEADAGAPVRQMISRFESGQSAGSLAISVQEEKNIFRRIQLEAFARALEKSPRPTAVIFPVEHDESPAFIAWKRNHDLEKAATETGRRVFERAFHHIMDACNRDSVFGFDPVRNRRLEQAVAEAVESGVPAAAAQMAIDYAHQGFEEIRLTRRSEAEEEASGAHLVKAILSVPDGFVESALTGHGFMLHEGGEARRHVAAARLWDTLAESVWVSGEPSVFFRDSAKSAVSFLKEEVYPSASGGFVFSPGTAAPAATINLQKFMGDAGTLAQAEPLAHAARLMSVALDMSCSDATQVYRPLALGMCGFAGFLMGHGLAYDSDEGRTLAALLAALVTGAAALASAEMAAACGSFPAYRALEKEFIAHVRDKRDALTGTGALRHGMARRGADLRPALCADKKLLRLAEKLWAEAYVLGKDRGWRNAHWTVVDTAEEVHALLDSSGRDLMPESVLVCLDENFGKTLHPLAARGLAVLGLDTERQNDIYFHVCGHGTLLDAPSINHATLKKKGFHQAALMAVEEAVKTAQDIRYAFNRWTLGEDFCQLMLGFEKEQLDAPDFDMLTALGFSPDEIEDANLYCCGAGTLEGAPHLTPAQLAVFDGQFGRVRRVSPFAQVHMQAAVETFLSGAAVLPLEIDVSASVEDIQKLFLTAWELGAKTVCIYRRNSALDIPAVRPLQELSIDSEGTRADNRAQQERRVSSRR